MKELKDSMDTIRLTAADFLEKLEAAVAERSAERMTAMQYAEKLIADREQEKTIFDDEQRNFIVNFAFDRLHIKQAERRQKDNAPQQEQERSRKS